MALRVRTAQTKTRKKAFWPDGPHVRVRHQFLRPDKRTAGRVQLLGCHKRQGGELKKVCRSPLSQCNHATNTSQPARIVYTPPWQPQRSSETFSAKCSFSNCARDVSHFCTPWLYVPISAARASPCGGAWRARAPRMRTPRSRAHTDSDTRQKVCARTAPWPLPLRSTIA